MTENTSLMALKAEIALGAMGSTQLATLDRRTRKELERQVMEMVRVTNLHMAAQKAVGTIYTYTLHQADTTLTAAELIKSLRSPLLVSPELDKLDEALRSRYLESMNFISANAVRTILADLD